MSEPTGTMECPICGQATPHGHDRRQVSAWINAQAGRFGYRAVAFTEGSANDFIDHVRSALRERQDDYLAAYGNIEEEVNNAIIVIDILETRRTELVEAAKPYLPAYEGYDNELDQKLREVISRQP